jgi:hypothetical protein
VLDAVVARNEGAHRQLSVLVTVEVQPPPGAVEGRGDVMPFAVSSDRGNALHRVVPAIGPILEVGDEHAARRIDAEEIIHVGVAVVGLGDPLGDDGDSLQQPVGARVDACPASLTPDPGFEGEDLRPQVRRAPERDVRVGPVEIDGEVLRLIDGGRGEQRRLGEARHRGPGKRVRRRADERPAGVVN